MKGISLYKRQVLGVGKVKFATHKNLVYPGSCPTLSVYYPIPFRRRQSLLFPSLQCFMFRNHTIRRSMVQHTGSPSDAARLDALPFGRPTDRYHQTKHYHHAILSTNCLRSDCLPVNIRLHRSLACAYTKKYILAQNAKQIEK